MEYNQDNFKLVRQALIDCAEYLETVADIPDMGTCNMDECTIDFTKWPKSKVESLPYTGYKLSSKWWRGAYFINFDHRGQANNRSNRMQEAVKFLRERGVNACMYYQMD